MAIVMMRRASLGVTGTLPPPSSEEACADSTPKWTGSRNLDDWAIEHLRGQCATVWVGSSPSRLPHDPERPRRLRVTLTALWAVNVTTRSPGPNRGPPADPPRARPARRRLRHGSLQRRRLRRLQIRRVLLRADLLVVPRVGVDRPHVVAGVVAEVL